MGTRGILKKNKKKHNPLKGGHVSHVTMFLGRVCDRDGERDAGQVLQRQQAPRQGHHRRAHEAQGSHQGRS